MFDSARESISFFWAAERGALLRLMWGRSSSSMVEKWGRVRGNKRVAGLREMKQMNSEVHVAAMASDISRSRWNAVP